VENRKDNMNHFSVSIVKSIFRIVAGGLLSYGGYVFWSANMYSDIFIADSGFVIMLSGGAFVIAEALGIIEEIV
jgi:hypothetical protein|tara:strand:+ start:2878 stop:3099 length:222 start_codon:yes stop_codon:yes gene_type:complete